MCNASSIRFGDCTSKPHILCAHMSVPECVIDIPWQCRWRAELTAGESFTTVNPHPMTGHLFNQTLFVLGWSHPAAAPGAEIGLMTSEPTPLLRESAARLLLTRKARRVRLSRHLGSRPLSTTPRLPDSCLDFRSNRLAEWGLARFGEGRTIAEPLYVNFMAYACCAASMLFNVLRARAPHREPGKPPQNEGQGCTGAPASRSKRCRASAAVYGESDECYDQSWSQRGPPLVRVCEYCLLIEWLCRVPLVQVRQALDQQQRA